MFKRKNEKNMRRMIDGSLQMTHNIFQPDFRL